MWSGGDGGVIIQGEGLVRRRRGSCDTERGCGQEEAGKDKVVRGRG